jgi:hypothetical protein
MKIYADTDGRRSLQMLGDLLLVGWIYLWVQLALVVRDATLSLARPGEEIAAAGTGLAARLRDAGDTVGGIPFVGDEAKAPFEGAGGAADRIAAAGQSQVEAVTTLAFWLSLAVGAIPVLIALIVYLPLRWRFVREATAGSRFLRSTDHPLADHPLADPGQRLDLFALRAMSRQPLHKLARVSHDPAGAWRRGDGDVIRALATLELRDSGLAVPASSTAPHGGSAHGKR